MLTSEYKNLFPEMYPEFCLLEEAVDAGNFDTLLFLLRHGAVGVYCQESRDIVLET